MNVMNLLYWFQEERPVYVAAMTAHDGYTYKEATIKIVEHPDTGVTFVTVSTPEGELRLKPEEVFDNPRDAIEFTIYKNIEILRAKIARFALEEDVEKEGQE
jgi:hypothetical protein